MNSTGFPFAWVRQRMPRLKPRPSVVPAPTREAIPQHIMRLISGSKWARLDCFQSSPFPQDFLSSQVLPFSLYLPAPSPSFRPYRPALPPVLIPGFDLGVRQIEGGCQIHAILDAQVFLPLEAPLQLVELMVGEGSPRLARLLRPHRGTVPAAGNLAIPFFFCP